MLCTPPAFILSQDQTLEIIVSKRKPFDPRSNRFRVLLLALYFCLSSILILRIVRDPFAHTFICFVLLSCCSIFKDHVCLRSCGDLNSIPHPLPFVNTFFKTFSSFFRGLNLSDRFVGSPFLGEPYYDTTISLFCQAFFSIFLIFFDFWNFFTVSLRHCL